MEGVISLDRRCGICNVLTDVDLYNCKLCKEKLCTSCYGLREKLVNKEEDKTERVGHCSGCELLISIKSLTGARKSGKVHTQLNNLYTKKSRTSGKYVPSNVNDENTSFDHNIDSISDGTNHAPQVINGPQTDSSSVQKGKEPVSSDSNVRKKNILNKEMTKEDSEFQKSKTNSSEGKPSSNMDGDNSQHSVDVDGCVELMPTDSDTAEESLEYDNLGMLSEYDKNGGEYRMAVEITQIRGIDDYGRQYMVTQFKKLKSPYVNAEQVEYDDKTGLPVVKDSVENNDAKKTNTNEPEDENSPQPESEGRKKKRKIKRQSSQYTCTGCGRRDCQSNFMKLLREMVVTARTSGFEIRNVIPDGNCMFAAVVDQLEVKNIFTFSPKALRLAAVEFLKRNPESEDGTSYSLFLDNEDWDTYLDRMSQEGSWGDHIMLQAIAQVTEHNIQVIHSDGERNWTVIESKTMTKEKSDHIYLGHVGEFHYVSLRPSEEAKQIHKGADESDDEDNFFDFNQSTENLPFVDDEKKHEIFTDEYVEPFSDIPAFHMSFILRKLVPFNLVLDNADRVIETAEGMLVSETHDSPKASGVAQVSYEYIGDAVEGLSISILAERRQKDNEDIQQWEDVPCLMLTDTITAFPKDNTDAESRDVFIETDKTHAGYVRLLAKYPDMWGTSERIRDSVMYYLPNSHAYFQKFDRRSKDSMATNQYKHPNIHTLIPTYMQTVTSPFWPQDASEWKSRTRKAEWPNPSLIEKIISEGCHYECVPHPKSTNPEIEFRTCFGIAEKTIAKTLTREQRYCFLTFRAFCSQEFEEDELITSVHLKSIFFRACEQIMPDIWATKPGACFFYLLDSLSVHIDDKNIPSYFITTNNLIDHLSETELQSISEKMLSLRSQPFTYLTNIAHKLKLHYATNVLESIREDIILFKEHRNTRESMLQTFVPISIRVAAEYIRSNSFKQALEMLQEAYEDRLTVSTCEDAIPFTAFLTQVSDGLSTKQQWWFFFYVDQKLYTTLCSDFSMQLSPVSLEELVGKDVADTYIGTLIPASMAQKLCNLCSDFALYFYTNYHTSKCLPFLHFAVEQYRKKQNAWKNSQQHEQGVEHNQFPNEDDFTDFNIFRVFHQLYCVYHRLNQLWILREYLPEAELVCEKLNSRYKYRQLSSMLEAVGETEKSQMALARSNTLPADSDYYDSDYY